MERITFHFPTPESSSNPSFQTSGLNTQNTRYVFNVQDYESCTHERHGSVLGSSG